MTSTEGEYNFPIRDVVCKPGGPYDGESFSAGTRCGEATTRMYEGHPQFSLYVPPALVPQLELLAMHFGYNIVIEPWDEHEDEWAAATFIKTPTGTYDVRYIT